jgi:hypothetical protein
MSAFAFVLPTLPGKEQTDIDTLDRMVNGEERDAFIAWHRSHGVTRHAVWHQSTPNGTLTIVLLEAEDIPAALEGTAQSQEPFDIRFREFVKDIHGVDLASDPPPDVRPVIDVTI